MSTGGAGDDGRDAAASGDVDPDEIERQVQRDQAQFEQFKRDLREDPVTALREHRRQLRGFAILAVLLVVVGVVYVLAGSTLESLEQQFWSAVWFLFLVLLFVGGLLYVKAGFTRRKRRELIEDTPTEDVRSLSTGFSEINGEAVPIDGETLDAPFTDGEALVRAWKVEEWHESGDSSSWRTRADEVDAVPFAVDDGTGRLRVEPPEGGAAADGAMDSDAARDDVVYEVEGVDEPVAEVDVDEEPPEPIQAFVERSGRLDPASHDHIEALDVGKKDGDRRYYQGVIAPGEEIYVLGTAASRDGDGAATADNAGNLVLTKGDHDPVFIVSDKPEDELIEARRWDLLKYFVVGLAVSAVSLAAILFLYVLPLLE